MENTLQIVNQQKVLNKNFTVYGSVENPIFLAKDVAEWIDYSKRTDGSYNVSVMLNSLDEEEKIKLHTTVNNLNGGSDSWFVTEDGLYEILMLSRKPVAKQFKKEVKKILHQIRMTGGYSVPKTFAEALLLAGEQQKQIEAMKPKTIVYDDLVDRSKAINFRDFASKIGLTQNEFMTILKSKYIYKNSIGEYRAYAEYQDLFTLRTFAKGVDKTGEQLMLSMKGITYFCNKYKAGAVAESFISKGDDEYQKIINDTAEKMYFSLKEVCKLAGQPEQVIMYYLRGKSLLNKNDLPNDYAVDMIHFFKDKDSLTFTKKGKDNVVTVYREITDGKLNIRTGKAE